MDILQDIFTERRMLEASIVVALAVDGKNKLLLWVGTNPTKNISSYFHYRKKERKCSKRRIFLL